MMQSAGIVVHHTRAEALDLAREVLTWLTERGISARLDITTALRIERQDIGFQHHDVAGLDFLITLGGDGTILRAARLASGFQVPILGVHLGRFGFIAEFHPSRLFVALEQVVAGNAQIEDRMMVAAEVVRNDEVIENTIGLNEAVVKSGMSHMLRLRTRLSGQDFTTIPADGIILSTPTGSTAYALSAGGPILEPTLQALLMIPICPHTLSARPMVLPAHEVIDVEVEIDGGEVVFSVDGLDPVYLENGDRVNMRRSKHVTRLITDPEGSFYRKVRDRYLYGERLNR
jgi:NAD+ kinase